MSFTVNDKIVVVRPNGERVEILDGANAARYRGTDEMSIAVRAAQVAVLAEIANSLWSLVSLERTRPFRESALT